MKKVSFFSLLISFALTAATPALAKSAGNIRQVAAEAYEFSYALLYNYKTMYTQTQDTTFAGYIGGFGQYRHYSKPSTPADKDIVTPNNDTAYSWAWLDLRREPVVFSIPAIAEDRYYVFQWLDLFTNIIASPGTRVNGNGGTTVMFAGPHWSGKTPQGIDKVYQVESNFIGTLTRTGINKGDTAETLQPIQRQYVFTPLSVWTGKKPLSPAPRLDFPVWHEELARKADAIGYVNFILCQTKQNPDDAVLLEKFKAIGIERCKPFERSAMDSETLTAIEAGFDDAFKKMAKRVQTNKSNIGLFGSRSYFKGDFTARSIGAMIGIYGMNEEEAVYFSYQLDSNGNPLDGNKAYQLRFPPGKLPPVRIFWSLTMYNLPERLLVKNPISRYSIGDRTPGLVQDPDGGLTITLSSTRPAKGKNWLPTPKGNFFMVMRNYGPDKSLIDGSWVRPEPIPVTQEQ